MSAAPVNRFLTIVLDKNAEIDEVWSYLRDGIEYIMHMVPGQELSFSAYTNMYTTIFNHLRPRPGGGRYGAELYDKLRCYLAEHLTRRGQIAGSLQDVDFLRYYAEYWHRYTTSVSYLNRLFIYLNRYWIKRERDEGRNTTYPVYTLALMQWNECIFVTVQLQLTNAILRQIARERNGETVDQGLLKYVLGSLVALGLNRTDPSKVCLDIYKEHFEVPFIIETERYYKEESERFLADNSVSDYLRKVEERLREEEDRVERYLRKETGKELIAKCEHVLIREQSKLMWDNLRSLFDGDKEEDMQRMYALLSRIPKGLDPMRQQFEVHVKQAGLSAISALDAGGSGANALRKVQRKYTEIVDKCCNGDVGFAASLDKACQELA